MLPETYSCPSCKCHALCRVRRKGLVDRVFTAFGLRPVRCLTCGSKSYMRVADRDIASDTTERTPVRAPLARVAPVQQESGTRRAA